MTNFEGEALAFCELRFPRADPDRRGEIEARLDALAELSRDEPGRPSWAWLARPPGKGSSRRGKGGRKRAPEAVDEDSGRLLGLLQLDADTLLLQTNSVERCERGRTLLSRALGPLVGEPLTRIQTLEQALAAAQAAGETPPEQTELPFPAEEEQAALRQILHRHYRATLSALVTMLGGRTPKQAVRSRAGRAQVVDWIKHLENQEAHRARVQGETAYDFAWMWQALGIADLRQ